MVTVRYFAAAREAAGTSGQQVGAATLAELADALRAAHGDGFTRVLAVSTLLVDGHRLDPHAAVPLPPDAVVDVLPPFAGG